MKLAVRKIVVAGMFGAIAIALGATRLGFIPVPTPAAHATIMHIPAIIGGVIEGPVVGIFIGLIFGIFSFLWAQNPIFADPFVSILPRAFIGLVAYLFYALVMALFRKKTKTSIGVASGVAAVFGTLTNTSFVLGMAVLRGYFDKRVAISIGILHGVPEIVVAVIIAVPIVLAIELFRLRSQRRKAQV